MLDCVDQAEADQADFGWNGLQRADVEGDLDKADRHQDACPEHRHPSGQARRGAGQEDDGEGEQDDERRTDRLEPGSPEDGGEVLTAERAQLGSRRWPEGRDWWRTTRRA